MRRKSNKPLPTFLYGTAWKEDDTERLTFLAIQKGFRGIDTANQRKHYFEAAVGNGIAAALQKGIVEREELFLQTKFTFLHGQDHRLPYDPQQPVNRQVVQSFESSLEHLHVDFIDSYLLHGPSSSHGLTELDWEAWYAMEALHASGRVGSIGISNVNLMQLEELVEKAQIPPSFVQNRCYAVRYWDQEIRNFCSRHQIVYQGFSLLTANRPSLASPVIRNLALAHRRTIPQILFNFAIQIGILPLTGTTDPEHMRQDLESLDFQLTDSEIAMISEI